jgi:hypothetical protein
MGLLNRDRRERPAASLPETGDLLAVEAIDRSGLVITSEGTFVRILHVTPPNPIILSPEDRLDVAAAYCAMLSRLRPRQTLQFYVEARPANLTDLLAEAQTEVAAWAGEAPAPGESFRDGLARSRWRLYAAMEESLRLHADDQAAVQLNAYVVIPTVPSRHTARAVLHELRGGKRAAPLERGLKAHRRAVRENLAQTDTVRMALEGLSLPTRLLNGEEVAAMLWARFNPTQADAGRRPPAALGEVMGDLEEGRDRTDARNAALRLRELIGASSIDWRASRNHTAVDEDVEQAICVATTADATSMGWLLNTMLTRQPFSLSVHVRALDRRRERQRIKAGYRRLFAVNRGAEARGRVPDFDRYAHEGEVEMLLSELAGQDRANLFEVSIYQSLRARGPNPDLSALAESVDFCVDQIRATVDCRVQKGEYQQRDLWLSTLPLARDVARRVRKYVTRNAGDMVPLVGVGCGSPTGIPFAFSDPGRTVERLNPYDRTHANHTLLVNGRSGSGKTVAANVILARCVAHGARGFVLDRAGHYETLTRLVDGARQIDIGADDSPWAINPWDVADPAEPSLEKIAFLVSLHGVMMGDEGLTTLERSQLGTAIRAVYARAGELGGTPRESMLRDELLRRSDVEREQGAIEQSALLRNLAERLGEFCGSGSYAYLVDRETTVPADSVLVVFDTRHCPEVVLKPVMFSIIEYVTRSIEAHRAANRERSGGPNAPLFTGRTVLLIDEAWHLVGRAETGEFANDLARRARHLGLFLIVMSQHLSDFSTEHGLALIRNATMQLFLAQHPDEIPFVREALRLSEEEAGLISRLKTVKGAYAQMFWVNGTRGKGRVALRLGPVEYWCATSDPVHDVPARDLMIDAQDGDVWNAVLALARGEEPPSLAEAGG